MKEKRERKTRAKEKRERKTRAKTKESKVTEERKGGKRKVSIVE